MFQRRKLDAVGLTDTKTRRKEIERTVVDLEFLQVRTTRMKLCVCGAIIYKLRLTDACIISMMMHMSKVKMVGQITLVESLRFLKLNIWSHILLLNEISRANTETSSTISSEISLDRSIGESKSDEMTLLDLYSGCGAMSTGLCLGANLASLNLVTKWAVDLNKFACESLKLNHPETQGIIFEVKPLMVYTLHSFAQSSICLRLNLTYGPSEDTWEFIEGLSNCKESIKSFVVNGFMSKILPVSDPKNRLLWTSQVPNACFPMGAWRNEKLPQYPLPTYEVVVRGNVPSYFEVINDESWDEMPYGKSPKTEFQ
ncbi:hypothetical protein NE237_027530 [Protea cynaroides]|uniref:Uncharacterized protein n=1 Tax=Protea cynaroides TaxID=273540 RepID=A0A9Q0GN62_9MAGN|nr:hypothetical protein NE237_027530 [Protea cynaroides]